MQTDIGNSENKIHCAWWVDVQAADIHRWHDRMSSEECQRAQGIRHTQAQRQFIVSRLALRQIISLYTGMDAMQLSFAQSRHGKPYLNGEHAVMRFNLSHSHSRVLIAVSTLADVGADIEMIRDTYRWQALAKRYFASEEIQQLFRQPENEQLRFFFKIWTHKEAYIKARGQGLSYSLTSFAVDIQEHESKLLYDKKDSTAADDWRFQVFTIHEDYTVAVASQSKQAFEIDQWELNRG